MSTSQALTDIGIVTPVFQAPIGSVASPELAAAVSNAGGVGHLACTWRSPADLRRLFAAMDDLTDRPYGANFVLGFPIEQQLAIALEHGVRIISFFWGDGGRFVGMVKDAGALAVQVAGSIDEARCAADAGFDLVVAQGHEAGGHVRGTLGSMALVPQVVDAIAPLPVLAAGGIADSRGVAAALALGAAGVWVGTRFLAASEANIHPRYQERVLQAAGDDTLCSQLFDVGWSKASLRTLRNGTTRQWEEAGRPLPGHRPGEGDPIGKRSDGSTIPRYHFGSPTRGVQGAVEDMALYAGEAVGLVHETVPAGEIVRELAVALRSESIVRAASFAPVERAVARIADKARTLCRNARHHKEIRQLRGFSDEQLNDIGLRRGDVRCALHLDLSHDPTILSRRASQVQEGQGSQPLMTQLSMFPDGLQPRPRGSFRQAASRPQDLVPPRRRPAGKLARLLQTDRSVCISVSCPASVARKRQSW